MWGAVYEGPGKLEIREIETPQAGPGEMVLRLGANTVCGTDGRIMRGEKTAGVVAGTILGHEIAGYVTEIGDGVTGFDEGDLVSLLPMIPCGECYFCRRDLENLCPTADIFSYNIDGGLAEYIKVPKSAFERGGVFKAAAHLAPQEACLAEPLGCVINGAHYYKPEVGDTVVIMGAGPIGMLHTQLVRLAGASQVIVTDFSEPRLKLIEALGATATLNPSEVNLNEFVRDNTDGIGADVVIIAIGQPALLQDALVVARKGGRVNAFAGFSKASLAEVDPNLIHYGELHVTGTSNARRQDHELALKLIGEGKINVKALHTHSFPISQTREAIEFASGGDGVKIAVVPD